MSADELLGLRPFETSGMSWKAGEVQQSGSPVPCLNQSQIDSIFDFPSPVSGESKKVLAVDDADFMRMMLEDILTKNGHTFLGAKDGQECLDILQNESVDVCVLDIRMPGMDGMEVLKRIKTDYPEIKVVMLSAMCDEGSVKMALQLGADAYVAKPFQADCLINRIG